MCQQMEGMFDLSETGKSQRLFDGELTGEYIADREWTSIGSQLCGNTG
jgi:hypothetical protein